MKFACATTSIADNKEMTQTNSYWWHLYFTVNAEDLPTKATFTTTQATIERPYEFAIMLQIVYFEHGESIHRSQRQYLYCGTTLYHTHKHQTSNRNNKSGRLKSAKNDRAAPIPSEPLWITVCSSNNNNQNGLNIMNRCGVVVEISLLTMKIPRVSVNRKLH